MEITELPLKQRSQIYEFLAKKYLDTERERSMCQVCTEYRRETGLTPIRRSVWNHVKNLREKRKKENLAS